MTIQDVKQIKLADYLQSLGYNACKATRQEPVV